MNGRENQTQHSADIEDQDAEPTLNAPGEEGPTGITAPDEDDDPRND
jgi:hypothetical protein